MNQKEEKCYRNKIVYLSFVMALLIIVRHSSGIGVYKNLSGVLYYIELFMGHFTDLIVPMFFAISGFLFYQNYDRKKLISKWNTRFKSLVIPFIAWNLFGYGFTWLLFHIPGIGDAMNRKLPDYNLLTWAYDVFFDTRYNVTWFIRNLIIYIIITPIIFRLLRNRIGGGILLLVILLFSQLYDYDSILRYSTPYIFGAYWGINFKSVCQRRYNKKLRISAGGLLFFSLLLELFFDSPQYGPIVPIRLLQIPLIWVASDIFAIEKMPKWWMKISFFIYCCHSLVLESVEKLFWVVLHDTYTGAIIDYLFAPLITFGIILALAYILKKNKMVWALLNGGRGN